MEVMRQALASPPASHNGVAPVAQVQCAQQHLQQPGGQCEGLGPDVGGAVRDRCGWWAFLGRHCFGAGCRPEGRSAQAVGAGRGGGAGRGMGRWLWRG